MESSSFNIINRLQRWMNSVPGQTFLNYAYSWGASIVILGALFKLTHLYGADLMLFIGMGTEVIVFFLSAFDRPFEEIPDDGLDGESEGEEADETDSAGDGNASADGALPSTIIINGGGAGADGVAAVAGGAAAVLAGAEEAANPGLGEATQDYVEKLRELTETLSKVEEQSRRMATDSGEMESLNRTLTGINTVYELQLKSISSQIGTIDRINEQTRKLASQIEELNGVYGRMIKALTVNMRNAAAQAGGSVE